MERSAYIIRSVVESDLERVYALELESHSTGWSYNSFASELRTPYSRFYIAEKGNEVLGFIIAWEVSGEVQLNNITVHPEHRRKKVGSALLEHLMEDFAAGAIARIQLEVREKNLAAREFYRAAGFVENGFRRNYYPDDNAVLMEKELTR